MSKFFADSKSRALALSNDESFVIFGHKTLGFRGAGIKLTSPPNSVFWFSSIWEGIGLNYENFSIASEAKFRRETANVN